MPCDDGQPHADRHRQHKPVAPIEFAFGLKEYRLPRPDWLDAAHLDAAVAAAPAPREAGCIFYGGSRCAGPPPGQPAYAGLSNLPLVSAGRNWHARGGDLLDDSAGGLRRHGDYRQDGSGGVCDLAGAPNRPPSDKTVLDGLFDLKLDYAPERGADDTAIAAALSIFIAVRAGLIRRNGDLAASHCRCSMKGANVTIDFAKKSDLPYYSC